jgi:hypothetical protein
VVCAICTVRMYIYIHDGNGAGIENPSFGAELKYPFFGPRVSNDDNVFSSKGMLNMFFQ